MPEPVDQIMPLQQSGWQHVPSGKKDIVGAAGELVVAVFTAECIGIAAGRFVPIQGVKFGAATDGPVFGIAHGAVGVHEDLAPNANGKTRVRAPVARRRPTVPR